jgi:hypothetical protein
MFVTELENITKGFDYMRDALNVEIHNVDASHIMNGDEKQIVIMLWHVLRCVNDQEEEQVARAASPAPPSPTPSPSPPPPPMPVAPQPKRRVFDRRVRDMVIAWMKTHLSSHSASLEMTARRSRSGTAASSSKSPHTASQLYAISEDDNGGGGGGGSGGDNDDDDDANHLFALVGDVDLAMVSECWYVV